MNKLLFPALFVAQSVMAQTSYVAPENFTLSDDLEVSVWATSPMLYNPTNMDVDDQGRVWVAEGRVYRAFRNKVARAGAKDGDRIMVLSDTDYDGQADSSHVFVQDPELVSPLGVAVIGNKVVVSQPPSILVYHDVNEDAVFDPEVDHKEVLLTGFGGKDHDHSLHSVSVGPSGQWYFNTGNAGTHIVEDKDGWTLRLGSSYKGGSPSVTKAGKLSGGQPGLVSDDGHVYVGGAVLRMNADGSGLRVVGHNMRNSYEEVVSSYGDVFQNDNDDPPACRTTWLMEYANMGFSSDDGTRKWQSSRRPGQPTAVAHWRQEDPGKLPAGDVYGNGSPTGITFYENGALGSQYEGLLLSCESARNVIFGYYPKPQGAGFALERFDFLKVKGEKDAVKKGADVNMFRPSDIAVGPDGCLYVADWFDSGVGGHKTADSGFSGTIYRIAPKGANPAPPVLNLETTEGQVEALMSPAHNVRSLGLEALKAQGSQAIPAVKALLSERSGYQQARALWLLAQLGEEGVREVEQFMQTTRDPQLKITCFRALRFVGHRVTEMIKSYKDDPSVALRREMALALRDQEWSEVGELLYDLAIQYDGVDPWYLEAIGTAASGKESELYHALIKRFAPGEPVAWTPAMAKLAWRLHPDEAVGALRERAMTTELSKETRVEAMTALGHIFTEAAALAMVDVAEKGPKRTRDLAQWWLASLSSGKWAPYKRKMKGLNVNPAALSAKENYLVPLGTPMSTHPTVAEVSKLKGDPVRGQAQIARCYMCHQVGEAGIEFGPNLSEWGLGRSVQEIANAIINPSDAVAHGYEGSVITTKHGNKVQGICLEGGRSVQVTMRVMGGGEVLMKFNEVSKHEMMKKSLMLSAGQLGLSSQDVADIAAYLKSRGN